MIRNKEKYHFISEQFINQKSIRCIRLPGSMQMKEFPQPIPKREKNSTA